MAPLLAALALAAAFPAVASAAKSVGVTLSPATILADGRSASVATASVKNTQGRPVDGDQVTFTASGGQAVSTTTNNRDGTYTATVTSTTTAGMFAITASDASEKPPVSASATLTQVPGPVAQLAVTLSPRSILADGRSTSTVTATASDALGNRVSGASIGFSASDGGVRVGPVSDNRDGTYTATLQSSTSPGVVTVLVRDAASGVQGSARLTLANSASALALSAAPAPARTNQTVTLIAIVSAVGGGQAPAGTVSFQARGRPIGGCERVPVIAQGVLGVGESACEVSFAASGSPIALGAVFSSTSASVADSSAQTSLSVGRSATSTLLDVSNPSVAVGSAATFTAQVAPADAGPALPSGTVDLFDGGLPIAGCTNRPLLVVGGASSASCTVSYDRSARHAITARYGGDQNFTPSGSGQAQPVSVRARPPRVLGTVRAVMQWTFSYSPRYTKILLLVVRHAPVGGVVAVRCSGRGCPYARRVDVVRAPRQCTTSPAGRCAQPGTVDLGRAFRRRRLAVGSRLVVTATRPGFIGKYYLFRVLSGRSPAIRISCLSPGGSRPGVGC